MITIKPKTMTPEQKAKEIVEKYYRIVKYYERAKACAIEEVKAVIKAFDEANAYDLLESIEHYQQVLTEIENL